MPSTSVLTNSRCRRSVSSGSIFPEAFLSIGKKETKNCYMSTRHCWKFSAAAIWTNSNSTRVSFIQECCIPMSGRRLIPQLKQNFLPINPLSGTSSTASSAGTAPPAGSIPTGITPCRKNTAVCILSLLLISRNKSWRRNLPKS